MKKNILICRGGLWLSIISILLTIYSCAAVLCGTTQKIKIRSNQVGADVYINNVYTGKQTPCKVEVKRRLPATDYNRRKELIVDLKKEGFANASKTDYAGINGLLIVDFAMGVWPGLVDIATGSHLHFKRNIYIPMTRVEEVKPPLRASQDQAQVVLLQGKNTHRSTGEARSEKNTILDSRAQLSDVDINIPKNDYLNPNRFALIIGNEDYASHQVGLNAEVNVKYAASDAFRFNEYCKNVMGIAAENIIFITDATMVEMSRGITKMNLFAKSMDGQAEIIFYYAGHGLPHEETREPYLLPVDIAGSELNLAIKLTDVYQKLTEYPVKSVTCFLDCCFSGGARDQQLLAVRGVKIKPKEVVLNNNLIVFSASSGNQSALAYDEKNHGLFTYFLLKKLQETSGNVTYSELADYVRQNVSLQAIRMNSKEQEPQLNISSDMEQQWMGMGIVK